MSILVFCGNQKSLNNFSNYPDWRVAPSSMSYKERGQIISWFLETTDAKLAVDVGWISGWRVPSNTIIMFDSSWQYGPDTREWKQAIMRRNIP